MRVQAGRPDRGQSGKLQGNESWAESEKRMAGWGKSVQADRVAHAKVGTEKRLVWLVEEART